MLAMLLLITGILFRFIPHAANMTPVAAIALFGGSYLSDRRQAIILPLALMIISDLFLGLHDMVAFTWGATVLVSMIGVALRNSRTAVRFLGGTFASSLVFFIVTNFGVWSMGWYPPTPQGLAQCYVAAIPFFRNFLMGTLVYGSALFGAYALARNAVRSGQLSRALLTR